MRMSNHLKNRRMSDSLNLLVMVIFWWQQNKHFYRSGTYLQYFVFWWVEESKKTCFSHEIVSSLTYPAAQQAWGNDKYTYLASVVLKPEKVQPYKISIKTELWGIAYLWLTYFNIHEGGFKNKETNNKNGNKVRVEFP